MKPDYTYKAKLVRVIDGDTVDLLVDLGHRITIKERYRLSGINTPEVRGKEREAGLAAKRFLMWELREDLVIQTDLDKKGKYGRYLATLYVDGRNINQALVDAGHAVVEHY